MCVSCLKSIIYLDNSIRKSGRNSNMSHSLNDQRTKELFKQAMVELLEERKDLIYDLFAEVVEDALLANAIREGASSEFVDRAEIMRILEGD
jgi:hypothetical protein